MIEKHVKLGDHKWMHCDDVAIDVHDELPEFVNKIRKASLMMGQSKKKQIYRDEFHKYLPLKNKFMKIGIVIPTYQEEKI